VNRLHPLLILAVALALPPVVLPYRALATRILIFGLFALGYTGLLSFGLGAYTTGLTPIHWQLGLWQGLACGVLAAALVFGWFCLRSAPGPAATTPPWSSICRP
jgi:hypothetical protein